MTKFSQEIGGKMQNAKDRETYKFVEQKKKDMRNLSTESDLTLFHLR